MCLVLAPFTLGGLSLNLQNICYHQSTFLAYVTKSNLTLWYSEGLLTAIYGKFWLTHPNCCFHLFFLLMCKSCGFIFVSNPTFFSCINAWVAFFYYWDFYCENKCVKGECVSGREAEQLPLLHHQQRWRWRGLQPAQNLWLLTSVWWGSYQYQRSMEAAFMKETP